MNRRDKNNRKNNPIFFFEAGGGIEMESKDSSAGAVSRYMFQAFVATACFGGQKKNSHQQQDVFTFPFKMLRGHYKKFNFN